MHIVVAHHGVNDALEIMNGLPHFQANPGHTAPMPFFEEAGHGALDNIGTVATGILQKFGERVADDLLKSRSHEFGKATVGSADFTIEGYSNQNIVKRIDQVPIALLRAFNHRK